MSCMTSLLPSPRRPAVHVTNDEYGGKFLDSSAPPPLPPRSPISLHTINKSKKKISKKRNFFEKYFEFSKTEENTPREYYNDGASQIFIELGPIDTEKTRGNWLSGEERKKNPILDPKLVIFDKS